MNFLVGLNLGPLVRWAESRVINLKCVRQAKARVTSDILFSGLNLG